MHKQDVLLLNPTKHYYMGAMTSPKDRQFVQQLVRAENKLSIKALYCWYFVGRIM